MKTLTLKLKKDILIVDAMSEEIANGIIVQEYGVKKLSEYKFFCQGTPTEEQAAELVDSTEYYDPHAQPYPIPAYKNYNGDTWGWNAVESFISAISAENWYWLVNPYEDYKAQTIDHYKEWEIMYKEAEPRTFKNPIIFIK